VLEQNKDVNRANILSCVRGLIDVGCRLSARESTERVQPASRPRHTLRPHSRYRLHSGCVCGQVEIQHLWRYTGHSCVLVGLSMAALGYTSCPPICLVPIPNSKKTRSLAVARIADCIGCEWPSRSSKVNDFHLIWKDVYYFLLIINGNLGPISQRFRNTAIYSLKLSIENCGQTAAYGDMVTIDNL